MAPDPLSALAFSIYAQKGVYALLLGSGISRDAGILPGWDMTLDLVRKYAKAEKDPTDDPRKWYLARFGKEPDYSEVLEMLGKTPSERRQLLEQYFEANAEERENNPSAKMPTAAHRAIAELVAKGYIKVILTTNFDRLTERALEDAGVSPHVIVLDDGIKGRLPFAHAGVTVVKLHGDYRDTRLLNTPAELEKYTPSQVELLRETFDTFGLIVSGWSGEYDDALRNAITANSNWRFSFYFTGRSELKGVGKTLVEFRKGTFVKTDSADQLFIELRDRIEALESMKYADNLTPKIATARVKNYVQDNSRHINLHDLLVNEAEHVAKLCGDEADFFFEGLKPDVKIEKVNRLASLSASLVHMVAACAYWAPEDIAKTCLKPVLEKVVVPPMKTLWADGPKAELYPAMLCLYAAGVSCVLREKYDLLKCLTLESKRKQLNPNEDEKLAGLLNSAFIFEERFFQGTTVHQHRHSPISWLACDHIREAFVQLGVLQIDYERAFDDFEIMLSIQCWLELRKKDGWAGDQVPAPTGRFSTPDGKRRLEIIAAALSFEHGNWKPFASGLFGQDLAVVQTGIQKLLPFTKVANLVPSN